MLVATKTFRCVIDGVEEEIVAGSDRIHESHPLARRYPDAFRSETLSEELQIRSRRIAELNDRARRSTRIDNPHTEARREEERFWEGAQRLVERTGHGNDSLSSSERRFQDFCDTALESGTTRSDADELLDLWHGSLG